MVLLINETINGQLINWSLGSLQKIDSSQQFCYTADFINNFVAESIKFYKLETIALSLVLIGVAIFFYAYHKYAIMKIKKLEEEIMQKSEERSRMAHKIFELGGQNW